MNYKDLNFLKNWFSDYCKSFYSSNAEDQKNIFLKVKHTFNVCENIIKIADEQLLSQNEIMLAETAALFHDVGRFLQYVKYKTFNDSISVNHANLGAKILHQERLLQNLPENEQELIIHTVKFHNTPTIPDLKNSESRYESTPMGRTDPEKILFLKLIRDADKLDIWRVFIEYYESSEAERASAASHGLPDIPEYSEKVLSYIYERKVASIRDVKTLNDFKLMQLSWIYDLNFYTSFRLLLERDYIKKTIAKLPKTDKINRASPLLHEFAYQKIKKGQNYPGSKEEQKLRN